MVCDTVWNYNRYKNYALTPSETLKYDETTVDGAKEAAAAK